MEVHQVTIHVSGQPILRNISAQFPKRKLSIIVGKSGVGKTTLLKSLSGLTVPTEGQIKVGEAVSEVSGGAANIAEKTGLVFQFPDRYFLGSTIQQEMTFNWLSEPPKVPLIQTLRRVGLDKAVDTAINQLSGGEKRKLAIAVQLDRNPEVLLLDEPLAGLDPRSKQEISTLLARLANDITVVAASHETAYFDKLDIVRYTIRPEGIQCETA